MLSLCTCHDRQAEDVAALVGRGWDQIEASRFVYTDAGPGLDASPAAVTAWVTRVVADATAPLRRRWGL